MSYDFSHKPLKSVSDRETRYLIQAFLGYVSQMHDIELCDEYPTGHNDTYWGVLNTGEEERLVEDFLTQERAKQLWKSRHPEDGDDWEMRVSLEGETQTPEEKLLNQIELLIAKEVLWCEDNKGKSLQGDDYETGFIAGLNQVREHILKGLWKSVNEQ